MKERCIEVYGHDNGFEQEEFQLMEEMDNSLEEGVDYELLEKISNGEL